MIEIEFNGCIAVDYDQRQQFWDWAQDCGIYVECWGCDYDIRKDFWRINDDQKRAWAALKWS